MASAFAHRAPREPDREAEAYQRGYRAGVRDEWARWRVMMGRLVALGEQTAKGGLVDGA